MSTFFNRSNEAFDWSMLTDSSTDFNSSIDSLSSDRTFLHESDPLKYSHLPTKNGNQITTQWTNDYLHFGSPCIKSTTPDTHLKGEY